MKAALLKFPGSLNGSEEPMLLLRMTSGKNERDPLSEIQDSNIFIPAKDIRERKTEGVDRLEKNGIVVSALGTVFINFETFLKVNFNVWCN